MIEVIAKPCQRGRAGCASLPNLAELAGARISRDRKNRGFAIASRGRMLASGKVFDFRPYALIEDLKLLKPKGWCYEDTAAYGHFGRSAFPWEKLGKVDRIKRYVSCR